MNELPSLPPSDPHTGAAPQVDLSTKPIAGAENGREPLRARPIYAGLAVLTALLLAQWWTSHSEINSLRREIAQRLQSGETLINETKLLVKSLQETTKELQAKVAVIEGKQKEAQSQQMALEQLYQDLSKNRDDWALAENEQVLTTATQQLHMNRNV